MSSWENTIKDTSTNEILAYNISKSLKLDIVLDTLKMFKLNSHIKFHRGTFIHSDQGAHYTSPRFQKQVKS